MNFGKCCTPLGHGLHATPGGNHKAIINWKMERKHFLSDYIVSSFYPLKWCEVNEITQWKGQNEIFYLKSKSHLKFHLPSQTDIIIKPISKIKTKSLRNHEQKQNKLKSIHKAWGMPKLCYEEKSINIDKWKKLQIKPKYNIYSLIFSISKVKDTIWLKLFYLFLISI